MLNWNKGLNMPEAEVIMGSLVDGRGGQIVKLPNDNLEEELEKIKEYLGTEEIIILDWENNIGLNISIGDSVEELNEGFKRLRDMNLEERDKVLAIIEYQPITSLLTAIDIRDEYQLQINITDYEDLGLDYIENMGLELPDLIMANLDLDGVGKDLSTSEGYMSSYGWLIRV